MFINLLPSSRLSPPDESYIATQFASIRFTVGSAIADQGSAIDMTPEDMARLLGVDVEVIREHARAGAPKDNKGRVHMIYYVAWLIRQTSKQR